MTDEGKLRDPDIRETLRDWAMELWPPKKGQVRHLEEFQFGLGTIADYLIVRPDVMMGFEIKSDVDSLNRLKVQVPHYNAVCNRLTLVTTWKYANPASRRLPPHWGIIAAERGSDGLVKLKVAREGESTQDEGLGYHSLAMLLLKEDALDYIMRFSRRERKMWSKFSAHDLKSIVSDYLSREEGLHDLAQFVRARILARSKRAASFDQRTGRRTLRARDTG